MDSIATSSPDAQSISEKFRALIREALFSGRYGYNFRTQRQRDYYHALQIDRQRARAAARSKAYRERQKAERPPTATPFDPARYRREIEALKVWLAEDGRPQRKLRLRAKDIALVRLCCAETLAGGEKLTHTRLAETLSRWTKKPWTRHEARHGLGWIKTLEEAGVWKPLDEPEKSEAWGIF